MAAPRRHQVLSSQAVTATGNSGPLPNLGETTNPTIILYLHVTAVSGSSPSITFALNAIGPDNAVYTLTPLVAITAMTAIGTQRVVFQNVYDQNVQLNWTVSGTTPSLTCDVDIFFTSPDN